MHYCPLNWCILHCIIDSSFIYAGQDVNGSLFFRREEVVHLSGKCLEGNSQSKRRSNARTNKNKPPQVKLQICSYTCRYTRTYNILKNSAVTKTLCNCVWLCSTVYSLKTASQKHTQRTFCGTMCFLYCKSASATIWPRLLRIPHNRPKPIT